MASIEKKLAKGIAWEKALSLAGGKLTLKWKSNAWGPELIGAVQTVVDEVTAEFDRQVRNDMKADVAAKVRAPSREPRYYVGLLLIETDLLRSIPPNDRQRIAEALRKRLTAGRSLQARYRRWQQAWPEVRIRELMNLRDLDEAPPR